MLIQPFSRHNLLIYLLLISTALKADEYAAESDFFGESPVVLTVSRMHKPLADSPASVTVIDRQMIRNSGAREIADIFRLVPGFIVGYQSGHTPVVTYNGLGHQWNRQLQVLVDGRSVFIPSFGGVPWSNLPLLLEDIERVEVTRGPNAVTYGANAFLATINIITRHAAEDLGSQLIVTHDLDDDSNAQDIYFRYGNNYDDLDWRITAGRVKDGGFADIFDSKILETFNVRTDFLTAYNQFWTVQAGINESSFGRGTGSETNIFRDEITSNSYQNIKWELLQDRVNTTVLLTHTRQDVDDQYQTETLNSFLADEFNIPAIASLPPFSSEVSFNRISDRTDIEIYQNRMVNEQTTWVYGGSIRKDKVKSFYLFNNKKNHQVDSNRLFSSLEWKPLSDLILDVGFMLEDTNLTSQEVSARVSLIKKIDQHNLRFVTSTAKRNPVLGEVIGNIQFEIDFPAGLGPPLEGPVPLVFWRTDGEARPETIKSVEIGLFSEYLDRQLTTDIKLFRYEISDQIFEDVISVNPDPVTGLPQTFGVVLNGDETTVDGIEASFNFSPQHKKYRLYGGLSIVANESFNRDAHISIPDHSTFIGGHINPHPDHQLSTSLYQVDDMSWLDSNDKLESYQKLDMRYQYTIDHKHGIRLELIGYNLLEDYEEYFNDIQQEKTFLLRVSGRF